MASRRQVHQQDAHLALSLAELVDKLIVDRLALQVFERFQRGLGYIRTALVRRLKQRRYARRVTDALQRAECQDAQLPVTALRGLEHGRHDLGLAAIRERIDQQALSFGRGRGQCGQQGIGNGRIVQFH